MSNLSALIGIAIVVFTFAALLFVWRSKSPSINRGRSSMRLRIAFGVAGTAILAILWITYDLSIGILPALMVPIWIPILSGNKQAAPRPKSIVIGLARGITLLVGISVLFLILQT